MGSYDFSKRYNHSDEKTSGKNFSALNISKDVKFYKPKYDKNSSSNYNRIDIVPYGITTKMHPLVAAGDWSIGDFDYVLDIWVHKNVGPSRKSVVCPYRNYGKPCPICEETSKAYDAGDKEKGRLLKAQRRVYYNVISRNKEDDSSMKLFDTSFAWFEEVLRKAAISEGEDEGKAIDYADPIKGKTVRFDAVDSELNAKNPALKYESFKFYDRDSIEAEVKNALPLDSFIELKTYEELEKLMYGADDDEEETEEEEEERKPVKPKKEEEPEAAVEKPKCPHGHRFGKDCDEFPECDKCPKETWKACDSASNGK